MLVGSFKTQSMTAKFNGEGGMKCKVCNAEKERHPTPRGEMWSPSEQQGTEDTTDKKYLCGEWPSASRNRA